MLTYGMITTRVGIYRLFIYRVGTIRVLCLPTLIIILLLNGENSNSDIRSNFFKSYEVHIYDNVK